MDRKGLIAISLAIIVLIVWQVKFAPKLATAPAPSASAKTTGTNSTPVIAPAPGSSGVSMRAATPLTDQSQPQSAQQQQQTNVAESLQKAASPSVEYSFTNLGGGIARAALLKHEGEKGSHVVLNEFGSLAIGAISEEQPGEGANEPYNVTINAQSGDVVCERTGTNGLQIVKKFTLPKSTKDTEEYVVNLDVSFTNRGAQPYQSRSFWIYTGSAAPIHQNDQPRYTLFEWLRGGKPRFIDVNWFAAKSIPLLGIQRQPERPYFSETTDNVSWAAVTSQYFSTILTPDAANSANGAKGIGVWAHRFSVDLETRLRAEGSSSLYPFAVEGALEMPGFTLASGQSATQSFNIFAGPKLYNTLNKLGHGEGEIMNFGMFGFVSKILLSSMQWLHSVTGSYAFAIILLTICIRGVLWPLQNRATQSMKQMQALQPKMNELREKYKDDPARMNQELMKVYKEYHINPFSGCLPMFVQIPVFFGFYAMLGTAIELRGSHFLWVHDLSQPDTIFHIGSMPVNVLPLCMAATMLFQMHLTPKSGDQTQQKVMMFVPLIFVVFCYNYASALALYWTVQNLFSIVQLYITRNRTAPVPVKATPARKKR